MDEHKNRVLLGLHDKDYLAQAKEMFEYRGYEVTVADNLEKMLSAMNVDKPDSVAPEANLFDYYFMDVNLGYTTYSARETIEPGKTVYNLVKHYVESGKTKFLSAAGSEPALELAKEAGIPCETKALALTKLFRKEQLNSKQTSSESA
jgi:hypothetical protein